MDNTKEISLGTNIKDTSDCKELINKRLELEVLIFARNEFRAGRVKIDYEVIKQTSDYLKDSKLIIRDILIR